MFPCDFEFDEETVQERADEIFQDTVFNDGCLKSYRRGHLSLDEVSKKIEYFKSTSRKQAIEDLEELYRERMMERDHWESA